MLNKEICWNITSKCNQSCNYCHRFLKIKELTFEENKTILNKLINNKITDITWTGGEALLLDYLDDLLKIAKEKGINNKLITNGILLSKERIDKIGKYLDSITLSLDSIDSDINEQLGRGKKHFIIIKDILDYVQEKYPHIKIRINTVICSYTKDINPIVDFLNKYNIYSWRLFKFMPLRELAIINRKMFDISLEDFTKAVNIVFKKSNISKIDTRTEEDMEKRYILILADGSIMVTENDKDIKVGNVLTSKLEDIF